MIQYTNSLASSLAPTNPPTTPSTPELPIALCKGIRSTHNSNPLYACTLHCHQLSPLCFPFISSFDSVSIPKPTGEEMADLAMLDEMATLQTSGTWELVHLPPEKTSVGCH